jgi:hypothetical protein
MKPTQAQSPAQKKRMMYFTKNALSYALLTTNSASKGCGMIHAGSINSDRKKEAEKCEPESMLSFIKTYASYKTVTSYSVRTALVNVMDKTF